MKEVEQQQNAQTNLDKAIALKMGKNVHCAFLAREFLCSNATQSLHCWCTPYTKQQNWHALTESMTNFSSLFLPTSHIRNTHTMATNKQRTNK